MFDTDNLRVVPKETSPKITPPAEFLDALLSLRKVSVPTHLSLSEIPAPSKITPFSAALYVQTPLEEDDLPVANGRFIVLYDPKTNLEWGSKFRIIIQVRAEMDASIGADPLLGEVIWSWLHDALDHNLTDVHHLKGTVTREHSETFGNLELTRSEVEIELKASWSTNGNDLSSHLASWLDIVDYAYAQQDPENLLTGPALYGL
ncbi:DUF3000 domain-containing protein [Gleimia sp. 6138-11-ORH1]|uniref:DUF3000 domain-containing protein n=1 Tax=Gleimia sp. 6138-11-ORH1 TaxID=2973937 RepID=UPI002166EFB0|nr:DUF3000 domain-containing protein [Gleimia sp. 6138-11-ORH1]MCS4484420.1 DUF3000 domain-containing protein [Gleimia sp. 6138-11-ORH1]